MKRLHWLILAAGGVVSAVLLRNKPLVQITINHYRIDGRSYPVVNIVPAAIRESSEQPEDFTH